MPVPAPSLRDLLDRAVAAGILSADQAVAVAALDTRPAARRGAVLAEVLGYVGGALAVVAALFLGAELWDELGPWPRVLLLGAVAVACLVGGAALTGRDGAPGRLGGFLWAAAVVAVAGTAGVGADGLVDVEPGTSALVAAGAALVVAAVLWWRRPAVLQHIATFIAAAATLLTALDRIGDGAFDWGGPLLWGFGLAWLAASALPPAGRLHESAPTAAAGGNGESAAGAGRPAVRPVGSGRRRSRAGCWAHAPSWSARCSRRAGVPPGSSSDPSAPPRWSSPGCGPDGPGSPRSASAACSFSVPLAVADLFDARLGPLVGILAVGLALVAAAVVLTRRAAR